MDILRFITTGSVDDGKSTLIGRLLYDSKSLFEDQIDAIETSSRKTGDDFNLALVTDGLKAEREQGITIDVAYKYFATPRRRFIIIDAPGHVQYTRNMVTGASNADLALILIDARQGVVEQTRRHSWLLSLLRIRHLVVCINKMDLVGWDRAVFDRIREDYLDLAAEFAIRDIVFIPISALEGDNVVEKSAKTPWYDGRSVLHHLEEVYIESDTNREEARFPVQSVIRPRAGVDLHDYRGYAGRMASGRFRKGDEVVILPAGLITRIAGIDFAGAEIEEAVPHASVTIRLADDIDVTRGDMIAPLDARPAVSQDFEADICWMDNAPLRPGRRLLIQHTTNRGRAMVAEILHRVVIESGEKERSIAELLLNDIARVRIRTSRPVNIDPYERNRATGAFILIDEATNATVAGGMITASAQDFGLVAGDYQV
jgi:sulfate adenylyltransferase subunit 1